MHPTTCVTEVSTTDRDRPRADGGIPDDEGEAEAEAEDEDEADGEGPTVLVVDDEENVARAYGLWLDGYDTLTATGGEEALELLDESVDVVLLDRRMPGLTGDEVLAEIRERGFACRVAMVTAVDPDFDVVDMDFDDYLTKPVTESDLRETVDRLAGFAGYDAEFREYFAVTQKVAALEAAKPRSELAGSGEYDDLLARRDDLKAALDETLGGFGDDAMASLLDDPADRD